ncbi:hypothetical protein Tco_1318172 [Tanacetum coccineum]
MLLNQPQDLIDADLPPDKVYKDSVKAIRMGLASNRILGACKKGDIVANVHVYVDVSIIFGSTNKELCIGFEKLMKDKFQMRLLLCFDGVGKPQQDDTGFVDSGCSRHMTGFCIFGYGLTPASRDTKIPQSSSPPVKVGDEVVHKELGGRMERASTTASSLEAEQDNGNIK